jgi:hypothetical protein
MMLLKLKKPHKFVAFIPLEGKLYQGFAKQTVYNKSSSIVPADITSPTVTVISPDI